MERQHLLELFPRLRRYARLLTGNDTHADDLVQETLVRGWQKRHLFEADGDLRAWLFAIMHNLHVSQWRSARRETESIDHRADVDSAGAVFEALPGVDNLIDLQRGLATLSVDHRQVLLLVCVEEWSYAEVGLMLGIPIGTVMSRLSRARAQLREWLDAPAGAAHVGTHANTARPVLRVLK